MNPPLEKKNEVINWPITDQELNLKSESEVRLSSD